MTRQIADHPKRPSRRLAAVVLGIFGVVGLGLGSASQVTLAANQLGAGATTIAPCQGSAPIRATFTSTYQASNNRYRASQVRLTDINAACNSRGYSFTIVTKTGSLAAETGNVVGGASDLEDITFTPVTDIVSILVMIP